MQANELDIDKLDRMSKLEEIFYKIENERNTLLRNKMLGEKAGMSKTLRILSVSHENLHESGYTAHVNSILSTNPNATLRPPSDALRSPHRHQVLTISYIHTIRSVLLLLCV
jgi:hypothetical protein